MRKQLLSVLLIFLLISIAISGCGQTGSSSGREDQMIQDDAQSESGENAQDNTDKLAQGKNGEAGISETVQDNVSSEMPVVYMTTDISPEGLMAVYEALNWEAEGKTAVKLSTGEPPASNYLRPELIEELVQPHL